MLSLWVAKFAPEIFGSNNVRCSLSPERWDLYLLLFKDNVPFVINYRCVSTFPLDEIVRVGFGMCIESFVTKVSRFFFTY